MKPSPHMASKIVQMILDALAVGVVFSLLQVSPWTANLMAAVAGGGLGAVGLGFGGGFAQHDRSAGRTTTVPSLCPIKAPMSRTTFTSSDRGLPVRRRVMFACRCRLPAVGYRDGVVRLYDIALGEELFQCPLRSGSIAQLAFAGDAVLAVADGEGSLQFVDLHKKVIRSCVIRLGAMDRESRAPPSLNEIAAARSLSP